MDAQPEPARLCACGHPATVHGPTEDAECEAEDCPCAAFVEAEEE